METTTPPTTWLDDRGRAAVRTWAMSAVTTRRPPTMIPNAVVHFCHQHMIPLDDPRQAARAILRTLTLIEAAQQHAP